MLRDTEFEELHAAAVQILEQVGFHVPDGEVLGAAERAGLTVDWDRQCVRFSSRQISDAISMAPKEVRLYAHPPDRYVSLGTGTRFMPSGTGVAVFDSKSGVRRDSRAADVRDLVRLQEALKHVDIARPVVTALEFEQNSDLVECYISMRYTRKPFMHRTLSETNACGLVRMGVLLAGGDEELRQRPPFAVVYCPKSPLSMAPEAARCMLTFASAGVPVLVLSMAMGGATSPVTLQGQVLIVNAEVLAGITLVQTLHPGTPVLYGSVASVLDMKTAVLALGAPERGMLNTVCAELAGRYGIPSVMGGLSTDAKDFDEQAGFEKALSVWPLMSKASLVFGMGLMDSANTYALEQLVLDDEMVGGMRRARMGIKLGDLAEEMALIKSIGFTGEYLSADHTLRNFRSNWQPELMTRSTFNEWQQVGTNLLEKTRHRIAKILDQGGPPLLDPAVDRDLKNLLTEYGIVVPDDL